MVWNPFDIIKGVTNIAGKIVDKIAGDKMDEAEKATITLEVEKMIKEHDETIINAQRDIMVAELQQGDKFTKRARPSIVYFGLLAIAWNFMLIPTINRIMTYIVIIQGKAAVTFEGLESIALPGEFWTTWGAVCAVYGIGRTLEKRGAANKAIEMITGNKK